jgi:predicted Zn-dependent protease
LHINKSISHVSKKGLIMLRCPKLSYKSLKTLAVSIFLIFFVTLSLSGCSVNPATGRQEFTPLLPASQEQQVGAEQHRSIVNEFGGIYENKKLTAYVHAISKKVAAASELPVDYYQIFMLNSAEVNAFALPGGYVYVTRGLVALANTEAELAGVIGHEIGHVTARHAANRSNIQAVSGIGAMLVGALTGSQQIAQLAQLGGQGLSASYSRGQEHEADMLGVRYLAKAGYNPYGQADFLRSLRIHSDYQKEQSKSSSSGMPSFFSTHPDTGSRVEKARELAQETNIIKGITGRQSHLNAINTMMWGDDPAQGIVQGQSFVHSDLRVKFDAPNQYQIVNRPDAVYIQGADNTLVKFDVDFKASGQSPQQYMQYEFAKGAKISSLQSITSNGLTGVTALSSMNTNNGTVQARLFAFKLSDTKYYRFIMSAPQNYFSQKEADFYKIARSLKRLSVSEAKKIKPYYVKVKTIRSSDSLATIARYIPNFNNKTRLLQMINGLDRQEKLPNSCSIKIISK